MHGQLLIPGQLIRAPDPVNGETSLTLVWLA